MSAQSIVRNIPKTYQKIISRIDRDQWQRVIRDESDSLSINKILTLVPKPMNKNIVDCKCNH